MLVNNFQNQTYMLEQYDMTDLNTETGTVWKNIVCLNPKYMYMFTVANLMVDDTGNICIK